MAATYGRFAGRPSAVLSTLGPGATNLVSGVGCTQLNGLPVVVITGQKPVKHSSWLWMSTQGAAHLEFPEDIARELVETEPMSQPPMRRPVVEVKVFQ